MIKKLFLKINSMNNIKIFRILICLCLISIYSQAQTVEFDKSYGGSTIDYAKNILRTPQGYLVLGFSNSPVSGDKTVVNDVTNTNDVWALYLDTNFNILAQNSYENSNPNTLLNDYNTSIYQDNNFIYFGLTYDDFDIPESKVHLFDIANQSHQNFFPGGNLSCAAFIYSNSDTLLSNYFKTIDGNYIYAATSGLQNFSCSSVSSSYRLQKSSTTTYNSLLWTQEYGGDSFEELKSVVENDLGYLLLGNSNSNISQDKTENSRGLLDFWIIQTEPNGNIIWQKTIGGSANDLISSCIKLEDGYLLAGTSSSLISGEKTENSVGGKDFWIVKLDFQGNIIWDKTIGGNQDDELKKAIKSNDGNVLLVGNSNSNISGSKTENSRGSTDAWLVKININGTILWDKTIGGNMQESINDIIQTQDNGYVLSLSSNSNISGEKSENSKGDFDYWLVKLTADNLNNQYFENINSFSIYPNPSHDSFSIFNETSKNIESVEIFSITGTLVGSINLKEGNTIISVAELQDGLYLVKINTENNESQILKFVKK